MLQEFSLRCFHLQRLLPVDEVALALALVASACRQTKHGDEDLNSAHDKVQQSHLICHCSRKNVHILIQWSLGMQLESGNGLRVDHANLKQHHKGSWNLLEWYYSACDNASSLRTEPLPSQHKRNQMHYWGTQSWEGNLACHESPQVLACNEGYWPAEK